MSQKTAEILSVVRGELNRLGYADELLLEDYVFDDASSMGGDELCVPLAAFAQRPPSYRNACIGVVSANGQSGPQHVSGYRTLGAPMFFEVYDDHLARYRVEASGKAVFLESISARDITSAFQGNKDKWTPDSIFRSKAIAPLTTPVQLDFIDAGLLPALKGMIHGKLDRLLKSILHEAVLLNKQTVIGREPDETQLFRLVFRLLAAKIFKDKRHRGRWDLSDAQEVIAEIQKFYGLAIQEQKVLDEPFTQQLVWDRFRNAFNFQNISVDDLAFIYENTLIQEETRRQLGVHSTPPVIAELMVDSLPFEGVPLADRRVLEPFAGHGIFLVAALRRLRELLPPAWTDEQRHVYLRQRLTAIEVDTFAAEVCRLSLTLADYPNPNGWEIVSQDIFESDILRTKLKTSPIVLCNPPFEDFTKEERALYGNRIASVHKPHEILRRVLEDPPAMFGFVLPKSALIGDRYRRLQDTIARTYKQIEVIALPDRVFAFSDQETVLLLSSERNKAPQASVSLRTRWVNETDRVSFLEMGQVPKGTTKIIDRSSRAGPISLPMVPLSEVWEYLKYHPKLGDIAEVHRGIEWKASIREDRDVLIALSSRPEFKRGLDTVKGKLEPYHASGFVYLNMSEEYRRTMAHFLPWDSPKVIANVQRISRGPWRIVGYPDTDWLVSTENFYAFWPRTQVDIRVLSALINSPLFNAALFVMGYGRHNPVNLMEKIPVPPHQSVDSEKITRLVQSYAEARSQLESAAAQRTIAQNCISIIMEIDGLVLKAYDLPPKLERKLLEFFRGHRRPVPFDFPDYYPADFSPCIPLHEFLNMNLREASAAALLDRIRPLDSEDVHELAMSLERGRRR